MARPVHPRLDDLPRILPIFPLPGLLLLPQGKLPLNIFEPRYLAMIEDALAWGRLFGIIQPSGPSMAKGEPPLYETGCAGRVSAFGETDDGRLLITVTGVCRFRVADEVEGTRGYRRVSADWAPFRDDLDEDPNIAMDRPRLLRVLKPYLRLRNMDLNWKALEAADDRSLIVSLCMACPFEPQEKQALLECADDTGRAVTLTTLMEMAVAERKGTGRLRQ